ncbi:MAG: CPBP family intramembrane metalloprotease [Peptococcaceae bacterium]|jgi:membrane protease YdiL (CAAX protease family)|nr:CPBP family intramembrane metalloprotease [Peptococcaceae bacterium]
MNEEQKFLSEPKLDVRTLLSVLAGIAIIFFIMPFVNSFIFYNTTDQKIAYYVSILASNSLFFLLILTIKFFRGLAWIEIGWRSTEVGRSLIDALKIWFLIMFINIVYIASLLARGVIPPENALLRLLTEPTLTMLLLNIFLIAVIAPIIEEALFRGILLGSLKKYCGKWTAIIISAAIFSALHLELFGFIPRMALGIGLGYLYEKYNSLLPAIGLHSFNNFLAVLAISFSS